MTKDVEAMLNELRRIMPVEYSPRIRCRDCQFFEAGGEIRSSRCHTPKRYNATGELKERFAEMARLDNLDCGPDAVRFVRKTPKPPKPVVKPSLWWRIFGGWWRVMLLEKR